MVPLLLLVACTPDPPASEPAAVPPEEPPPAPEAEAPAPDEPPAPAPPDLSRPPPEGFVAVAEAVPGAVLDIRYHTSDNFTGAPLPGYGHPGAWLLEAPARDLAAVQGDLAGEGLGLLIYDAYRPNRASRAMAAWASRSGNAHLLDGYIARVSNHNRGIAVDLSLVDLETGEPLDMGTAFDVLDTSAHTRNAEGEVLAHRLRLVEAMAAHGWRNYSREWWHFTWRADPRPPPRDVPYSCFEPPEGEWSAPAAWETPGWDPPDAWPEDASCPPTR